MGFAGFRLAVAVEARPPAEGTFAKVVTESKAVKILTRREGIASRPETNGIAQKCTLCYDRLSGGLEPACAHACPTKSIQFGPLDELRDRAQGRVSELHAEGRNEARECGCQSGRAEAEAKRRPTDGHSV